MASTEPAAAAETGSTSAVTTAAAALTAHADAVSAGFGTRSR